MKRHPDISITDFARVDTSTPCHLPLANASIAAGFPSPAQDYMAESIDLNQELIRHKETTFFARVVGDSMHDAGIFDGDLIVIDRMLEARDRDYVVACVDGEFTIKQYREDPRRECAWLVPANKAYRPIRITSETDFVIWGVVTYTIKQLRR